MVFQQTDLPPYTLSLSRFFVRQFDDFSLVLGIGQLTSHDGKFLGVCLQHFGFDSKTAIARSCLRCIVI
jgi:hypothetical protein